MYRKIGHPSLPCPTVLFGEIMAITQLRVDVHSGTWSASAIASAINIIMSRIEAFDPNKWTDEGYDLPDIQEVPLMANIYKLTVSLYGVMGLRPWLSGSRNRKVKTREDLMQFLRTAWELPNCRTALNWPLAVVGCALADGSSADRTFVHDCIDEAWKDPLTCQPMLINRLLTKFWDSGMQEWDDCWQDPIVVIG